jgi:hypothetical protein
MEALKIFIQKFQVQQEQIFVSRLFEFYLLMARSLTQFNSGSSDTYCRYVEENLF